MTWDDVASTLLARWPGQRWGEVQIAAYLTELRYDGLSAEDALTGLRASTGAFVPSVGELRGLVRQVATSDTPTFDEMLALLYGTGRALTPPVPSRGLWLEGERARAVDDAAWERIGALHPLIGGFVCRMGLARLRAMWIDDPDAGHWRRKELRESWEVHREAMEGREVALSVRRGLGSLDRLDPLKALGLGRTAIEQEAR